MAEEGSSRGGTGRRATAWAILLLLMAGAAIVLNECFVRARERARSATCQSNLKCLATHLLMYAQDYGGRLPPATDWRTALAGYVPNEMEFHCPEEGPGRSSGYALNAHLSRRLLQEIADPSGVVALFDSDATGHSPADTGQTIPVPPQHGKNTFSFLDGRARSLVGVPAAAWDPSLNSTAPR